MFRLMVCSLAALALSLGSAAADDTKKGTKDDTHKKPAKATITKIDPKAHSVTVKMKGKDGKDTEKVFKLTEEVRYMDSTGRVAAADIFQNGDDVLVLEEEGHLKEIKKDKKEDNSKSGNKGTADKKGGGQ